MGQRAEGQQNQETMSEIAVVILNWNTRHQLEVFLPNIIRHTQDTGIEIVVADNGSHDDSVDFMKEHYPGVRLIEFDKNHGFTGGYNKALSQIDARYYVLLNSDVEVTKDWLAPLKKCLDNHPEAAACMPKMKSYHQKDYFEYAGAAGGFIDPLGYPFCRGRILDTIEKDEGQYELPTDIFWATGACMLLRADLFHSQGGFDDDFFAHMEEIDLCWRLKNDGHTIRYVPQSTVYHVGGGTLPNDNPFKLYLNYRNNLFLLYKNLPDKKLSRVLALRAVLDVASSLIFLLKGKPAGFRAVFRAYRHFLKSLPVLKKKRKGLPRNTRDYPSGVYQKSILMSYFLEKKNRFYQLRFQAKN